VFGVRINVGIPRGLATLVGPRETRSGRRWRLGLLALAIVTTAAAAVPAVSSAAPSAPRVDDELLDVSVVSATDAWAVGDSVEAGVERTLVRHWDGSSWTTVPAPSPGAGSGLEGVSVVSSMDVWAVGYQYDDAGKFATLVEHWDGATWTLVPSPSPRGEFVDLIDVSGVSATDAWAVGVVNPNGIDHHFVLEHWDGSDWTNVAMTSSGGMGQGASAALYSVSASSSNDVWVVGQYRSDRSLPYRPFTEHWDGSRWTVVPLAPGSGDGPLLGVSALSPTDVWAVGDLIRKPGSQSRPVVVHWDGSSWTTERMHGTGDAAWLWQVTGLSSTDVWAVGNQRGRTLIMHWDGSSWTRVPSPRPRHTSDLRGLAAFSSTDAWVVGTATNDHDHRTALTEHWDGTSWTVS
jgi:hypothetical protein